MFQSPTIRLFTLHLTRKADADGNMTNYIIRRLFLLPLTLFAIILVNFIIINLAPGDPVSVAEISSTGEAAKAADRGMTRGETHYLQFREHYGLTLPLFFNPWPSIKEFQVITALGQIANRKQKAADPKEMSSQDYHALRTLWGDRARFIMPILIRIAIDPGEPIEIRKAAANLFIRGGIKQGYIGPDLSSEEKMQNRKIAADNALLHKLRLGEDSPEMLDQKLSQLHAWFLANEKFENFKPEGAEKIKIFFFDTRFSRYLSRVITLDFGTLRNDANKTVISEVAKRIKYSLTLALIPMLFTFALCQVFGMMMAIYHTRWQDVSLNILFLILFAIPIFVVAPFLIEKVALHKTFPLTSIPIPYSGFHSENAIYQNLTSNKRLADILLHIFLPLLAIMYGTLAVQARLSRTAILEVLRQDYVRTARAKGLSRPTILIKHVGRNAAITIVTSLAASLGIILGGSLIVETVFQINGFGRFFYEAIINRDFNVILFSAFASSFLTLVGYLLADISYTLLDPRVSLE